jgi:hypothetical protein
VIAGSVHTIGDHFAPHFGARLEWRFDRARNRAHRRRECRFDVVSMRARAYAEKVREHEGARLELRGPEGERVHVLRDRPLQRGDEIELLLADGYWLRGRYDWSGIEARWPGLRVALGGGARAAEVREPAAVMALHPDAIVRRPSSR